MARPLVVVFEELASPSTSPSTPDLNSIVIGPANQILDFPDDAVTILLSTTYGALESDASYVPPIAGTAAVTVSDNGYPGQNPGARVNHSTVLPVLRDPRVVLGSTYLSGSVAPVLGTKVTTDVSDQTLITLVGTVTDFVAAGIQPGDRIILTSSAGTQTVVGTVQSVGEPNSAGLVASGNETKLRISANLPAAGVTAATWTYDSLGECRIERAVSSGVALYDPARLFVTFPEPGTDKCVIKGGVQLPIELTLVPTVAVPLLTTSTVLRTLSYAGIYLPYVAMRQDLQAPEIVTGDDIIILNGLPQIRNIGKIDARNPLAVALSLALQNAGPAPVYYYGVSDNGSAGHISARAGIENRKDLFCLVPLTMDLSIIASYKFDCEGLADPNTALLTGVPQKFRIVVGSSEIPSNSTLSQGSISGTASIPSGAATALNRTLSITGASAVNLATVVPGDTVTIGLTTIADAQWQNRRGVHKVGHVNANQPNGDATSAFEIIPGTTRWSDTLLPAGAGNIELLIKGQDGSTKVSRLAYVDISTGATTTLGTIRWAMKAPTLVGGPYTVTYVNGGAGVALSVTVVGFAITVTVDITNVAHTHAAVAAAVLATPAVAALVTAVVTATPSGVGTVLPASQSPVSPTQIMPAAASCDTSITVNDGLYNKLSDTTAQFLTNHVHPGDILEFPLNPNNYSDTAFEGRTLTAVVAQVLSENALLIANGSDDSDSAANELPHLYMRDVAGTKVDNAVANALSYRVRRALTKDQMVTELAGMSQGLISKRAVLCFPDLVLVNDLRDGSLTRSVSTTLALAPAQPGYYIACQVAGALAGLPPQHGLTNLGLAGIKTLYHSQGYFREAQLTQISDAGWFVMKQDTPSGLPYCIHQLTTDPIALETGEISVVKNVDFLAKFMQAICEPYLGQYNVLPETLDDIFRAVSDGAENLKARKINKIGAPLLAGSAITLIRVSDFAADRIQLYFLAKVPRPLNTIEFHLVV